MVRHHQHQHLFAAPKSTCQILADALPSSTCRYGAITPIVTCPYACTYNVSTTEAGAAAAGSESLATLALAAAAAATGSCAITTPPGGFAHVLFLHPPAGFTYAGLGELPGVNSWWVARLQQYMCLILIASSILLFAPTAYASTIYPLTHYIATACDHARLPVQVRGQLVLSPLGVGPRDGAQLGSTARIRHGPFSGGAL